MAYTFPYKVLEALASGVYYILALGWFAYESMHDKSPHENDRKREDIPLGRDTLEGAILMHSILKKKAFPFSDR
ncbi:hypothetical protein J4461_00190 [Candidatus Pacearchaeota archaeon]|nr:hypothetical protein [Candidatus Pacearchaeota archaeon]